MMMRYFMICCYTDAGTKFWQIYTLLKDLSDLWVSMDFDGLIILLASKFLP